MLKGWLSRELFLTPSLTSNFTCSWCLLYLMDLEFLFNKGKQCEGWFKWTFLGYHINLTSIFKRCAHVALWKLSFRTMLYSGVAVAHIIDETFDCQCNVCNSLQSFRLTSMVLSLNAVRLRPNLKLFSTVFVAMCLFLFIEICWKFYTILL